MTTSDLWSWRRVQRGSDTTDHLQIEKILKKYDTLLRQYFRLKCGFLQAMKKIRFKDLFSKPTNHIFEKVNFLLNIDK